MSDTPRTDAATQVEYESRAIWIAMMNAILGYDNSDGFHSEPGPHDLAKQLMAEVERLRRMEDHQKRFPVLDAKWLDPECHHGCKSLVFKHERDALKLKLEAAKVALEYFTQREIYQSPLEGSVPRVLYGGHEIASAALSQLNTT